ncbi:MAG: hypothetical protein NC417_03985 [Candidatus Gastranaerophilales bacterium]|nr:hypothetical protein [Candidatus Gastranaerophilales bacterium]
MKRELGSTALKTIGILLAGILAGTFLMTLAYCIPVNMGSYYSMQVSTELEGWYPNVPIVTNTYNTYFQTFLPGVLDNATVRYYMLPLAYETGENPLVLAMDCGGYNYYWHGYVTIIRCLQLFMNYEEMQLANDFCQIALIACLAVLIGRRKGIRYVVMLLSGYMLIMPMAVSVCFQYSAVFYIAYGACLFIVWKQAWLERKRRYFYFFLIAGMLTSYFDLLTYPLFTWGIPMVWWLIMEEREYGSLRRMKKVVVTGVAWILGYGGMWAGKWVMASLVLRENCVARALEEVLIRSGADEEVTFGQTNRLYAIYMNWRHYNYKLYVIILLGWLGFWLFMGLIKGWQKTTKCCPLFLVGCSSFVWYIVLFNHTEIHHAFTYRILGISIAAFMAIVLESIPAKGERGKGLWHIGRFSACGLALMAAAAMLALCAREITQVDNKGAEIEETVLRERHFTVSYIPAYNRIYAIGLGLQTDSSEGEYELSLYDGEELVYRENIPVAHYQHNNFQYYNVDWSLEAGREYRMEIEIRGVEETLHGYYTSEGDLPLEGCQYLEDGKALFRQPLIGFQYWSPIISGKVKILLTFSYFGLLWVIVHVGACLVAERKRRDLQTM